ncbi:MAG: sigma factor-like helix-turn-helix DNA-binding protein [Bacteroidota bacterium]
MDTLPCQCKKVFKLSREKGLWNKEIASTLLISEKTVEYHMKKALTFMKSHLHPS